MQKNKAKGTLIRKVDFTGVETQNNVPNDNYRVKIADITEEEGDKGPYWLFKLEIVDGPYKGKKILHNCSLTKQSLWNLRATLEALGQTVPEGVMMLDAKKLINLEMGITTEIETYKGKARSKVIDTFSLTEMVEENNDDGDGTEGGDDSSGSGDDSGEGSDDGDLGLEKMSLKQLLDFAKENEIEISSKIKLDRAKIAKAIEDFLAS